MKQLFYLIILLVVVLFVVVSTRGPGKRSPRELLLTIASAGYEVTKGESIKTPMEGAEFAFWMEIDGHRIAAYRFGSMERASEMADSLPQGFAAGYWAFEHVDQETQRKIAGALGSPRQLSE